MFELFFLAIIVIVIIVISKRQPQPPQSGSTEHRGYWEGYNDHKAKVQALLDQGGDTFDRTQLESLLNDQETQQEREFQSVQTTESAPLTPPKTVDTSVRNMNIMLYLGSFLLVAAGAAFIGAQLPDSVKLIGTWIIILSFYIAGLGLHGSQPKLKPAATAFVGTGLAIVPFGGVAIAQYTLLSDGTAWLLTSILGLILYAYAALRLQSQVVSYLTLAFVLSLACSSVATASLPFLWYFVALIGVSLVASIVAIIKPSWVPALFAKPIETTGQIVTPVALIASLFVGNQLSIFGYEVVFAVATLHYAVAWIQTKRILFANSFRGLLHATLIIIAWDKTNYDFVAFGWLFIAIATVHALVSVVLALAKQSRAFNERPWLFGLMTLQLLSLGFWFGQENMGELLMLGLLILGTTSLVSAYALRDSRLSLFGVGASIFLPFIVGRMVIDPSLDWDWIAGWFVAIAALLAVLHQQYHRSFGLTTNSIIAGTSILKAIIGSMILLLVEPEVGAALYVLLVIYWLFVSYSLKFPAISVLSWIALTVAWWQFSRMIDSSNEWTVFMIGVGSAAMTYIATLYFALKSDHQRHQIGLASVLILLLITVISTAFGSTELQTAGAWMIIAGAVVIAIEARRISSNTLYEIAAYVATFGLQRVVAISMPDLNVVFYAHWWALTIAFAALLRNKWTPRLIIAAGIITSVTGIYALVHGEGYSLLFLVEHIALLIAGVALTATWAIWWGVIAASLAVLWFLRDITFLAFGFLGLLLIGIVVWRLSTSTDKKS